MPENTTRRQAVLPRRRKTAPVIQWADKTRENRDTLVS